MTTIFEKPIILEGEKDNAVLLYSEYIIANITKENAELTVERINKNLFNSSEFESIIQIKEVFEYEFERDIDACIMFGRKDGDGTSYKTIDFKDAETAIKAENLFKEQFKNLGFTRKEEQLSAMGAAVTPLFVTAIVAVIGGLITWFAYEMEDYENTRTRVVKWYVYLMMKISKAVGYMPFLVITGILLVLCLFWTVKRMANPPFRIKAVK